MAVCRTCFDLIKSGSPYFSLDDIDAGSSGGNEIRFKLSTCVPELNVDLVKNSVLCNSCVDALCVTYMFREKCLKTEIILCDYKLKRNSEDIDIERAFRWSSRLDSSSSDLIRRNSPSKSNSSSITDNSLVGKNQINEQPPCTRSRSGILGKKNYAETSNEDDSSSDSVIFEDEPNGEVAINLSFPSAVRKAPRPRKISEISSESVMHTETSDSSVFNKKLNSMVENNQRIPPTVDRKTNSVSDDCVNIAKALLSGYYSVPSTSASYIKITAMPKHSIESERTIDKSVTLNDSAEDHPCSSAKGQKDVNLEEFPGFGKTSSGVRNKPPVQYPPASKIRIRSSIFPTIPKTQETVNLFCTELEQNHLHTNRVEHIKNTPLDSSVESRLNPNTSVNSRLNPNTTLDSKLNLHTQLDTTVDSRLNSNTPLDTSVDARLNSHTPSDTSNDSRLYSNHKAMPHENLTIKYEDDLDIKPNLVNWNNILDETSTSLTAIHSSLTSIKMLECDSIEAGSNVVTDINPEPPCSNEYSGVSYNLKKFSDFEQQFAGFSMDDFYRHQLLTFPEPQVILTPLSAAQLKIWTKKKEKTLMERYKKLKSIKRLKNIKTIYKYKQKMLKKKPNFGCLTTPKDQSRIFRCTKCKYSAKYESSLIFHMKIHGEESEPSKGEHIHKCVTCEYSTTCKFSLYQHKNTHVGQTFYKCKACKFHTKDRKQFSSHVNYHKTYTYRCVACRYSATFKKSLQKHYFSCHFRNEPYECNLCQLKYDDKRKLIQHLTSITHTKDKVDVYLEHNYAVV